MSCYHLPDLEVHTYEPEACTNFFLHEYKHTPEDPIDVQGYKTSVSLKSLDIY